MWRAQEKWQNVREMPTLQDWVSALSVPRKVLIESSLELLAEIQAKQIQHDASLLAKGRTPPARKPNLALAPGLPPLQDVDVAPIHLLHRLGVVTTPAVPNLADICSTWAYLRYMWAFELPDGTPDDRLRLSQPARTIDFHQKGLMSDQIGVGMAALIMSYLFGAPDACDVDVAMGDPAWPIDLVQSSSPDYLFSNTDRSVLYVVECKGTRCSRNDVVGQLRRGTEQVPSLQFTDGRPPPTALVIGTQLTETGVHVFVIDPPSDGPEADRPRKSGSRDWRIPDAHVFEKATRDVAQAKVLAYAAEDEAAAAKMQELRPATPGVRQLIPRKSVVRENRFGVFNGSQDVFPFRDGVRVGVFQGLETTIRDGYIAGDAERVVAQTRQLADRLGHAAPEARSVFGFEREETGAAIELRSVAPDGTILELRFSPA